MSVSLQTIVQASVKVIPSTHIPIMIDRGSPLANPFVGTGRKYPKDVQEMYRQYIWKACRSNDKQFKATRWALRNLLKLSMSGSPICLVSHSKAGGAHGDTLISFISWATKETRKTMKARARKASK